MMTKIRNRILTGGLFFLSALGAWSDHALAASSPNGFWEKHNGKWYYSSNGGEYLTGWLRIGKDRYFLNKSGSMETGWKCISGNWYFFGRDGRMGTGWRCISGKWYYFNDQGIMQTGWLESDGDTYFLNSYGYMVAGWSKIGENWYFFNESGILQRDTLIDGQYVDENGIWIKDVPRSRRLNVECIYQKPELPNGCEVTSLSMVLRYMGFPVDKKMLSDQYLPKGSSGKVTPYEAFIGNPSSVNGWYCFSPVIVKCANSYLQSVRADKEAVDLSGSSFEALFREVDHGRPVIIWGTLGMGSPKYNGSWNVRGTICKRLINLHCFVLTGYDLDRDLVYLSDPLAGNRTFRLSTCRKCYEQLNSQAVVIRDRK